MRSDCLAQVGASLALSQGGFDPVEMLDLAHDPASPSGRLFESIVELPSHMRPAAGEFDAVGSIGKGAVSAIAIALQDSFEVAPKQVLQTIRGATGFPAIEHIATGLVAGPEIALLGLP